VPKIAYNLIIYRKVLSVVITKKNYLLTIPRFRFLSLKRPSSCKAKSEGVKSSNSASMMKKKKAIGAQEIEQLI